MSDFTRNQILNPNTISADGVAEVAVDWNRHYTPLGNTVSYVGPTFILKDEKERAAKQRKLEEEQEELRGVVYSVVEAFLPLLKEEKERTFRHVCSGCGVQFKGPVPALDFFRNSCLCENCRCLNPEVWWNRAHYSSFGVFLKKWKMWCKWSFRGENLDSSSFIFENPSKRRELTPNTFYDIEAGAISLKPVAVLNQAEHWMGRDVAFELS